MNHHLYIKTHNKTGMKYLGKTVQDPYKYGGSGTRWLNHLKKHGNDVTTEVIASFQSNEELSEFASMLSENLDVVKSNNWANLKPETGDGGDTSMTDGFISSIEKRKRNGRYKAWNKGINTPRTPESIEKQRKTITGKKRGSYKNYRYDVNTIPVIFRGVEYPSISEARRNTGASFYTVKQHSQTLPQAR
jgi:hypothetical protein